MEKPREIQLVQRLWSEHKYALIARDPARAREFGRRMSMDALGLVDSADAIEDLMKGPEDHLSEALIEAWTHLQPRVGLASRKAVEGLLARDLESARWLIGGLAESVGDGVVASSRLLDHPSGSRRIWIRDNMGPALYDICRDGPARLSPATVGEMLVGAFGSVAWRVMRLLCERPRTPTAIKSAFGPDSTRVLDAGHRLLLLRRTGGLYRPRGTAVALVLAGLGR